MAWLFSMKLLHNAYSVVNLISLFTPFFKPSSNGVFSQQRHARKQGTNLHQPKNLLILDGVYERRQDKVVDWNVHDIASKNVKGRLDK